MSEGMDWFWLPAVPAVLGWLLTIALGVLGATTVRRVDPRAGWLFVLAASLEVLMGIVGMVVPMVLARARPVHELASTMAFWGFFAGTVGLLVRGLFLAGVVALATGRARAPREEPTTV